VYEMIAWRRTGDTRLYAGGCSLAFWCSCCWMDIRACNCRASSVRRVRDNVKLSAHNPAVNTEIARRRPRPTDRPTDGFPERGPRFARIDIVDCPLAVSTACHVVPRSHTCDFVCRMLCCHAISGRVNKSRSKRGF